MEIHDFRIVGQLSGTAGRSASNDNEHPGSHGIMANLFCMGIVFALLSFPAAGCSVSWPECPLKTPMGVMRGTYQMVSADGRKFDIEIAPFALKARDTIN